MLTQVGYAGWNEEGYRIRSVSSHVQDVVNIGERIVSIDGYETTGQFRIYDDGRIDVGFKIVYTIKYEHNETVGKFIKWTRTKVITKQVTSTIFISDYFIDFVNFIELECTTDDTAS